MSTFRQSLFAVMVAAPSAFAGQLHVESYGLADVRKEGGYVVAGTVESFAKGKSFTVTVKATRVFGSVAPVNALGLGPGGPLKPPEPGASWTATLYGGVEWTDPGRSPIDRRLRNAARPVVVKGSTVYLVPIFPGAPEVELLEGTAENLRRIEVHFDDEARKRWLASATPVLEVALADDELAGFAFPELSRRGAIRAAPLLKAESTLAREYLVHLSPAARSTFFKDALALAKADATARDDLYQLACGELASAWLSDVAPLAELLPAAEGDAGRHFLDLRDELGSVALRFKDKQEKQRPDFTPFAPYLARWLIARPNYRPDDELAELMPFISAAGKQQLSLGLLTEVPKVAALKPDDPDLSLLDLAEVMVKQAPSPVLLEAIARVDPSKVRVTSSREGAMASLLMMGMSIAKANPGARRQVQEVLEPWLAGGVDADEETMKSWRKAMGPWRPGVPVAATFELSVGELRRLNTGGRASFTKDATAWGFTLDDGAEGSSTWMTTDDDWYRELHWGAWLLTIERVGREQRLKVKARPASSKLEPLDDPTTHDLLEAQAKKDGCPQYEDGVYDEQLGTFTYEASGPAGRKCSYRFGLFTRAMQKRVITN